ncbi:MAG TPA: hypothetical protein V6D14_19125 [Coleofasciculaceae cyanobacterium]
MAYSKRQKAEGRGQKAEGRGQKAEGRRQRAFMFISDTWSFQPLDLS